MTNPEGMRHLVSLFRKRTGYTLAFAPPQSTGLLRTLNFAVRRCASTVSTVTTTVSRDIRAGSHVINRLTFTTN
ncbi:hypothetical protein AB7M74_001794 [Bradyrhizobium japonicum]